MALQTRLKKVSTVYGIDSRGAAKQGIVIDPWTTGESGFKWPLLPMGAQGMVKRKWPRHPVLAGCGHRVLPRASGRWRVHSPPSGLVV
jgi:hypothetical protein